MVGEPLDHVTIRSPGRGHVDLHVDVRDDGMNNEFFFKRTLFSFLTFVIF